MERVKGIEPSYAAWEAAVLPLNYTRLESSADWPEFTSGWRPGVGSGIDFLLHGNWMVRGWLLKSTPFSFACPPIRPAGVASALRSNRLRFYLDPVPS